MIFVTVGTQLGFDRLIQSMDEWAGHHTDRKCFAQIGRGEYEPVNMPWERQLHPDVAQHNLITSEIVVSHAGMGTILTRIAAGRSIIVMPRLKALREHRTNHQVDTVNRLEKVAGLSIARSSKELCELLECSVDCAVETLTLEQAVIPLRNRIRSRVKMWMDD